MTLRMQAAGLLLAIGRAMGGWARRVAGSSADQLERPDTEDTGAAGAPDAEAPPDGIDEAAWEHHRAQGAPLAWLRTVASHAPGLLSSPTHPTVDARPRPPRRNPSIDRATAPRQALNRPRSEPRASSSSAPRELPAAPAKGAAPSGRRRVEPIEGRSATTRTSGPPAGSQGDRRVVGTVRTAGGSPARHSEDRVVSVASSSQGRVESFDSSATATAPVAKSMSRPIDPKSRPTSTVSSTAPAWTPDDAAPTARIDAQAAPPGERRPTASVFGELATRRIRPHDSAWPERIDAHRADRGPRVDDIGWKGDAPSAPRERRASPEHAAAATPALELRWPSLEFAAPLASSHADDGLRDAVERVRRLDAEQRGLAWNE